MCLRRFQRDGVNIWRGDCLSHNNCLDSVPYSKAKCTLCVACVDKRAPTKGPLAPTDRVHQGQWTRLIDIVVGKIGADRVGAGQLSLLHGPRSDSTAVRRDECLDE